MLTHRKYGVWIASALLACSIPTSASAASLACVQRAIDWNNASTINTVNFALVSLHGTGEGSYSSGTLVNSNCTRMPYAGGTVSCLVSRPSPVDAQLLHPFSKPNGLLRLSVETVPSDNLAQVHLRQPNATYDFDPVCVGEFLVGGDQWGNRWTMSFSLVRSFPPR